jgi:hypothetical protein
VALNLLILQRLAIQVPAANIGLRRESDREQLGSMQHASKNLNSDPRNSLKSTANGVRRASSERRVISVRLVELLYLKRFDDGCKGT